METNLVNNQSEIRKSILKTALIPQLFLVLISIVWIFLSPDNTVIGFYEFKLWFVLAGITIGLVLAFLGYAFYKYAQKSKKFYEAVELFENVLAPIYVNLKPIDVVFLSFLAAICEETFFRGLLMPGIGVILSSLAFGILHLPGKQYWIYAVWAAASGALFSYLFISTGSLIMPIFAHAVNNITGMILLHKVKK